MLAAEDATLQPAEEPMPQTDDPTHRGHVDAVDGGEHLRIATQQLALVVQCAQSLLGLADEVGVVLESEETGGVVDVCDGYAGLLQLLAEEHVLVAVGAELLVEGVFHHDAAPDEKVGGVKMLIGPEPALCSGMHVFVGLLVAIAQIALRRLADLVSAIYHVAAGQQIIDDEAWVENGHVAVEIQQPLLPRHRTQQITYACTPDVLFQRHKATIRPLANLPALLYKGCVCGVVVDDNHLEVQVPDGLGLTA